MKRILVACLVGTMAPAVAGALTDSPAKFSTNGLAAWQEKVFKGKTSYTLVPDEGRMVVHAHSRRSASGLMHKVGREVSAYPVLRWSWKVERSLKREDAEKKSGDDFAARVYVVFPRTFFWQTRAINYVWAGKLPKGSAVPSPYTANSIIVAAQSGDEHAGRWVFEERNIHDDYRTYFGEAPPPIGAVAIMSDTDDTGDESRAWYGDISLHPPSE